MVVVVLFLRLVVLSIPFAWDFSMHHSSLKANPQIYKLSFNSLCLGFFHASSLYIGTSNPTVNNFQFPLLGIFPCILPYLQYVDGPTLWTFNSLCLGFFHAS